jgi:hypothetical protein
MNAIATVSKIVLADKVAELTYQFDLDEYTPYQVHNLVNRTIVALGGSGTVRPQMMYNYRNNGMIIAGQKDGNFKTEGVVAFVVKYLSKNGQKYNI